MEAAGANGMKIRSESGRYRALASHLQPGARAAARLRFSGGVPHDAEGIPMPKVVFTHAVVDIDSWLKGKADRDAALGSNVVDYVAEDGSNNIAISAEVDDLASMQAMLA